MSLFSCLVSYLSLLCTYTIRSSALCYQLHNIRWRTRCSRCYWLCLTFDLPSGWIRPWYFLRSTTLILLSPHRPCTSAFASIWISTLVPTKYRNVGHQRFLLGLYSNQSFLPCVHLTVPHI